MVFDLSRLDADNQTRFFQKYWLVRLHRKGQAAAGGQVDKARSGRLPKKSEEVRNPVLNHEWKC
jgi:hypothetical protein